MNDRYGIDTHKLMYHPCRVGDWLDGKETFPILVNITPIGKCNHRCTFCGYNYTGYDRPSLKYEELCNTLLNMKENGVKAVCWDGTGEPLLHPKMVELFEYSHKIGLEGGLETNGVLLDKSISKRCADSLSYIKFSVDAGTPDTHLKLHRGKKEDFEKVIQNIKDVCKVKGDCVIGIQMLLFKENEDEIRTLLKLLEGVDYDWFAIKPFSQNPFQDFSLVNLGNIEKARGIPGVMVREYGFEREDAISCKRDYNICYGVNFFSNIDCNGNVTICNSLLNEDKYILGNIYEDSFENIWKNREIRDYPIEDCKRYSCRMDKQNVYLWNLKHPMKHRNFI